MYKVLAFDLDGTLTEPREAVKHDILEVLLDLSHHYHIAIISGSELNNIKKQLLDFIPSNLLDLTLSVYSGSGSILHQYKDMKLNELYQREMNQEDSEMIVNFLKSRCNISENNLHFIINKTHIAFTEIGLNAKKTARLEYDPSQKRRLALISELSEEFPSYQFTIGGSTSIDITEKGIDKSFAISDLLLRRNILPSEILYFGDRFQREGNDYPVLKIIPNVVKVKAPIETLYYLKNILISIVI